MKCHGRAINCYFFRIKYQIMNPNKALWEKGDFTRIADNMRESGEALIDTLDITTGMRVLDVGCGDGTTAIPAARRGANVTGVDIAENLVAAGQARARAEGITNIDFQQGDASDLAGFEDDTYDLVVSIFGAMFAPRPDDVARELVRVAKPGGRIVMGNWIPGDPTLVAQILRISSAYAPPPPEGFISPMRWGVEEDVRTRFTNAGIDPGNIGFEKATYTFHAPYDSDTFVDIFRNYYGPTMNAFEAAEKDGKADQLKSELETLFREHNKSEDAGRSEIDASFLKVTVRK